MPVVVRDIVAADHDWAVEALAGIGGRVVARRGELVDLLALPGLVAELDGERIGLLVYDSGGGAGEAELAGLATPVRRAGAGTALVGALRKRLPDRPIWVVTTNDNTGALRFYQRVGFVLRALRAGAVEEARRVIKPGIPPFGESGIPIRDELELVLLPDAEDSDDA